MPDLGENPASFDRFRLDPSDPAHPGQAVYTSRTLGAYDAVVVRLSNSLVWRCPARKILELYDRHVTSCHLDVGPGTAYYLDRCRFPLARPRLVLLDPNIDVLRFAHRRLVRYRPALHAADALQPIDLEPGSYRSIAASYVLHCLPGDIASKAIVFDHLIPLVEPGGVVFGTTILHRGVHHTRLARKALGVYNRKGIFANTNDDLGDLEAALAGRFGRYDLDVVGSVALFAGWAT